MARTPSKKKRGSGTGTSLRRGPRDPRQHVHSSGSGTGVPFNRGRRCGTHGVANSNTRRATSLPPILERNPVLEGIALDLTDAPDSGGVARALGVPASASTHRNRDDGVVVLDGADGSGLRELITFEGDENPDVAIGRALLESKMVEQLKRKANAQMLGFTPDHYKELVENLNGFPPAYSRRDQLIAMALQVDPGGGLMEQLNRALPKKLTKKVKKSNLADILVSTFFIVEEMTASKRVEFPSTHTGLGKALRSFSSDLVRVRNFCRHELQNEFVKQRALKTESITGEMTVWVYFRIAAISSNFIISRRGRDEGPVDESGHQEPGGVQPVPQVWPR